jgi:glutathione S-transferase
MSQITLYYAAGACSFVPHVALEMIGAPYEGKALSFKDNEQKSADYLAVNYHGLVPTLLVDGQTIEQVVAISGYLAEKFPEAQLLPTEPFAKARAMQWLAYMNNTIHPCFTRWFRSANFIDGDANQAALKNKATTMFREYLLEIQAAISKSGTPFLFGDKPSFADFYALCLYRWGGFTGIDPESVPALTAYVERMAALPAVARVMEREGLKLKTYRKPA